MIWILVIYIYAGALSKGDSVTLTTVDGFKSKQACEAAGRDSGPLVSGSFKDLRFACLAK